MFLEKEITKNWDPLFPEKLATEIEKQTYSQTGTDGVFKIPEEITLSQCYKNLLTLGFDWNREVVNNFRKEYTYFKVFKP